MNLNDQILIHHFLEKSARDFPEKVALIHEDIRATYAQINSKADQLACLLGDLGVTKGDRVVLILENCLEYVVSYYGILKAGAVAVPLSSDIKPEGIGFFLKELEPKVIIASNRSERALKAADITPYNIGALILRSPKFKWDSTAFSVFVWEDFINEKGNFAPDIKIDESSLACIIYTSGSTGIPKGVMLSHKNIVSNTNSICEYLRLTNKDIQMVVLPFFYVMGKSLLNTHFAVGGSVVINNKFAFPASVLKQMAVEQVTGFSGVPSTYAYLLHRSPLADYRKSLDSLRYCSQAGGHMSFQIKDELRKTLPAHTEIYIMYGATEASARLTYLEPEHLYDRKDSIGKAIPGVTVRIMGADNKEVSPGRIGEVVGAGANIMQGYWKDKQATERVLDKNGYHTGDLGYQDKEGFLYVVGRKDNLLKVGGHRINPQEIEDAIMESGLVIEAVVLGLPDELLGDKLVAIATPKDGDVNESHILSKCAQKLPRYKLPGSVILVKGLPKINSGKINRSKCLEFITGNKD